MNIEREYPLHVAVWNNDIDKLAQLIKSHKVSCFDVDVKRMLAFFLFVFIRIELNNVILVIVLRFN